MTLTTQLVNVGLSPNDGTGNNLRDAFIKTNENVTAITQFLMLTPTLPQVTVEGPLTADSITANTGTFNSPVSLLSNYVSTSPSTGSLVILNGGGIGVTGNVNVGGVIHGDVVSNSVIAGTMMVTGGAGFAGNVQASAINVGNLAVASDAIVNGNLTVFGNLTTVTTAELIIEHPTIEVGGAGNASLSYNDGMDRGVEFFWYDDIGAVQREGFFGYQNATGKFTFIPKSEYGFGTGDSDIYLGAAGTAVFDTVEANVTSIGTSTFETLYANTIIANVGITGVLQTNAQPNITSVGLLSNLDVSGNISVETGSINMLSGTLYVNGDPVATSSQAFHGGTVPNDTRFSSGTNTIYTTSGAVVVSGGMGVSGNVIVGNIVATDVLTANTINGTIATADQPNITNVGTLGNLVVTNSMSAYSIGVNHLTAASYVNATNMTATAGYTGTLLTAAQPNITTVGNLTTLNVVGGITANSFTGTFVGGVSGNTTGSATTVTANAQPAITSVGTLTYLDVSGNVTTSNIDAGANTITTTGNVSATNVNAAYLYGQLRTAAQPIITSLGNLSSLTVNGTSTMIGNVTFGGPLYAAGSGTQAIGSASNRFGTIYSAAIDNSGTINSGSFVGPINGNIGAQTPAQGYFTTMTASSATVNGNLLVTGTTQAGNISVSAGHVVSIIDPPTSSSSAVNKAYVDSVLNGLKWLNPIQGANLIGESSVVPSSPGYRDSYIVLAGAGGAWVSLVGHYVQWNNTTWVDLGLVSIGSRFGLSFESATLVAAPFVGHDNQIVTVTGGNTSGYTYTFYIPSATDSVMNNNTAAVGFGHQFTYSNTNIWVEFGGSASIAAGTALAYTSNTLNVLVDSVTINTNGSNQLQVVKSPNLVGGTIGAIPYQSAANTTAFLGAGSTSQVLVSGAAPSWTNTPTINGANFSSIPNGALTHSSVVIGSTTVNLGDTVTSFTGLSSLTSGNITVAGDTISSLGTTITIDPATSGVGGTVIIAGNLQVTGTTTTVNSTAVSVSDVNITLAKDAINGSQADGAGLTVAGPTTPATFLYANTDDSWNFNKKINGTSGVFSGNVQASNLSGTLLSVAQPNITSVGTLSGLTVTSTITGNISGSATTVTAAAQPAITSVGTLGSLAVTANVVAGGFSGTHYGSGAGLTNIPGSSIVGFAANVTIGSTVIPLGSTATTLTGLTSVSSTSFNGNVVATNLTGTLQTAAQPNVTSVGTLSALSVTGNVTTTSGRFIGSGAGLTANTVPVSSIASSGTASSTTFLRGDGNWTTVSTSGINGVALDPAALTINDVLQYNGTQWNHVVPYTLGVSTNTPSTLVSRDSNGNFSANVITATTTAAFYADLAEMYESDGQYEPGTVLVFGGAKEVTTTGQQADVSVAGVVSTNPAYLMNKDAVHAVAVALRGKVPVKLMGPVRKGDLLVTSYVAGHAESVGRDARLGVAIFAKSLEENLADGPKVINAVII